MFRVSADAGTVLPGRRGPVTSIEFRDLRRDPGPSLAPAAVPLPDKDPSTELSTAALGGGDPASAIRSPLEGPKRALLKSLRTRQKSAMNSSSATITLTIVVSSVPSKTAGARFGVHFLDSVSGS